MAAWRKNNVNIPPKEELEKLVSELPYTEIAKKYEVSDVSVKKWCLKLGIPVGTRRGFWAKKRSKVVVPVGFEPTTKGFLPL